MFKNRENDLVGFFSKDDNYDAVLYLYVICADDRIFQKKCCLIDVKVFLKSSLAPIYANFEGRERAEKSDFLVKTLHKVPENSDILFFSSKCRSVFF